MTHGLMKIGPIRRAYHLWERTIPFAKIFFTKEGIFGRTGRILIWGKFRRLVISAFPPLTNYLRKKYGLTGGCVSCGNSCNLLIRCPHWDPNTRLCTVYEDRPTICRTFPITPNDLRDRDLGNKDTKCGFTFEKWKATRSTQDSR